MTIFNSVNPATGEIVWSGKESTQEDVEKAFSLAKTAFEKWSQTHLEIRIKHLESFRDTLIASQESLIEAISKETGKPLWESKNEVTSMINKVNISFDAFKIRCPEIIQSQSDRISVTRHRPHGVVAVFGPFNFPGHLPNGHIVPALLAGNTVLFKPSEYTPLVAEITAKIWETSGLPRGVLNILQGGRQTGQLLADYQGINGLFFTGSGPTGKILLEKFASHPEKILALELGGNNPLVVNEMKNIEAAIHLTIQSAFLTAGQRCTCARRLIVPTSEQGNLFIEKLLQLTQKIKIGAYTDIPEPFMGPVISHQVAQKLLDVQARLIEKGATPLLKMELLKEKSGLLSPGIIDVTSLENRADEEYFGPFLQLIRVPDFKEAIQEANRTAYGLTAGLLSDNSQDYQEFYQKIRAGLINWNTPLTGASSSAPFGGVGLSGNHHPSAYYAADYCSYPVASMESLEMILPTPLPGIPS